MRRGSWVPPTPSRGVGPFVIPTLDMVIKNEKYRPCRPAGRRSSQRRFHADHATPLSRHRRPRHRARLRRCRRHERPGPGRRVRHGVRVPRPGQRLHDDIRRNSGSLVRAARMRVVLVGLGLVEHVGESELRTEPPARPGTSSADPLREGGPGRPPSPHPPAIRIERSHVAHTSAQRHLHRHPAPHRLFDDVEHLRRRKGRRENGGKSDRDVRTPTPARTGPVRHRGPGTCRHDGQHPPS